MRVRVLCTIVVVASLCVLPGAAQAAQEIYLEVPGVPSLAGEATAEGYQDQIELNSWSWGVSRSTSSASSTKASFSGVNVTKNIDRASPALLQYVASGNTVGSAKVHVVKGGTSPLENLTYCFTGVQFTSLNQSGSGGGSTESLSFSYQTIVERYKQQGADGSVVATLFGGWDLIKNLQLQTCS